MAACRRSALFAALAFLVGGCAADEPPTDGAPEDGAGRDGVAGTSGGLDHFDAGPLQAPPIAVPSTPLPAQDAGVPPVSDVPILDAGSVTPIDAAVVDPCQGYPPEGACVAPNTLYRCVIPTGNSTPVLSQEECGVNEQCVSDGGQARCELLPGACTPGESECTDPSTQRACDESGQWQETECAQGCETSPLGAVCASLGTTTYVGTLSYEARGPNLELTDWSASVVTLPAAGVLIVSSRNGDIVDSTVTDEQGEFEVSIPASLEDGDEILAMLVRPGQGGSGVAFAVMQPDVPENTAQSPFAAGAGSEPQHWLWSIDPSITPSGSSRTITEAMGSGAVRVFENLRAAYDLTAAHYGEGDRPLVVWLRMNASWTCGACFFDLPVNAGGLLFDSQIVLPATAQNTSYWADPVTSHELGHWVMSTFGHSPGEGGPHCVGVATFPGQAWSEGWATGFSSVIRSDAKYYDKQRGAFFWLDLDARSDSFAGDTWQRPSATAEDGVLQLIDEFEVSAMIWDLHDEGGVSMSTLLDALSGPLMTTAPFNRGYTRHSWTIGNACVQENVIDSHSSQPMFADYLDALLCGGVSESVVDAVTVPDTYYPYPSGAPLCVPGAGPP
jgi:hypothetical protein